jgi:hypothetical protein
LIGVPIFCIYMAWRFLRAYERRGNERRKIDELETRIARLEAGGMR